MFGKSVWAFCSLDIDDHGVFKNLLTNFPEDLNPSWIHSQIVAGDASEGTGMSAFHKPIVEEGCTTPLKECSLSKGIYGLWVVNMAIAPLLDPRVLQEQLSYNSYKTPFKFLPKEQKQDILDQISKEETTIAQSHVPVILDFEHGWLWAATSNKSMLEEIRNLLAHLEIKTKSVCLDFGTHSWPRQILEKIADGNLMLEEFLERAEEVKKSGDPKLVVANEDPVREKLLKKFFRGLEFDGYHIYLGTPSKLSLTNQNTSVGANTPWDSCEILNQGLGVASARITVQEPSVPEDIFSIEVSDNTHVDPGFILLKGIENHRLNRSIKETGLASGRLTIKDYWLCDYECNHSALSLYIHIVKDLLEIEDDKKGIHVISQEATIEATI